MKPSETHNPNLSPLVTTHPTRRLRNLPLSPFRQLATSYSQLATTPQALSSLILLTFAAAAELKSNKPEFEN